MTDEQVQLGKVQISAMILPEIYTRGRNSGCRWGKLVEMGLETVDLRFERNQLKTQIEKLQRAMGKIQSELIRISMENDALRKGIKPLY